ncbi:MAG: alpha/beta fold hydrolase [Proteobacteria bacterium]|nr:alpha/beta fold hydrolase [Pseudomonadota bacterium]
MVWFMKRPIQPPKPFATHTLPVGQGHTLYIEEHGNPKGLPVVVLHGGPGGGMSGSFHKRFPLKTYRIIAFDQRGCGKSTAKKGLLTANTTQHLVADIERIRVHLKIAQWVVTGASWGVTLALVYAQAHPQAVLGLILNAIYLGTTHEIEWFTKPDGIARFFPQEYAALYKAVPGATPSTISKKSLTILMGPNKRRAQQLAEAWLYFEWLACSIQSNRAETLAAVRAEANLLVNCQVQIHYYAHQCFLLPDQILKNAKAISHIPAIILHGELDMVCPPEAAYALHAALPQSQLKMLPLCGHYGDPAMDKARKAAATTLAKTLKKPLAKPRRRS